MDYIKHTIKIESIQNNIFNGDTENISTDIMEVLQDILQGGLFTESGEIERFNIVLQKLLSAMKKNDQLLTADILEYELIPLIRKN